MKPMVPEKKSLFAFAAVFGVLGGLIAGFSARSWVEIGPSLPEARTARVSMENLLASSDSKANLSDAEFFYELTRKLEQDYVEAIPDKTVLGVGAVRGMVSSLADPSSQFYDKQKWATHEKRLKGIVSGIGIDVEFRFDQAELAKLRAQDRSVDQLLLIPDLYVALVAPGSPAGEAGLQPGDQIVGVNGNWVMSGSEIADMRKRAQKATGAELTAIRERMAKLADKNITPARAEEVLIEDTSGKVDVMFRRAGKEMKASVARTETRLEPVIEESGEVVLNMIDGAAKAAAQLPGNATIDLRGQIFGQADQVVPVLEALGGGGIYGQVGREGNAMRRPIAGSGAEKDVSGLTVRIDEFTSGSALVVARALASRGARLDGKSSREAEWIEAVPLNDGSGYTLVTGIFEGGMK